MEATFIYLMVGLKIPIAMLLYLVWWAVRAVPDPAPEIKDEEDGGDGGSKVPHHPRPSSPPRPRPRGPHGQPAPGAPPRTRTAAVGRGRPARPAREP